MVCIKKSIPVEISETKFYTAKLENWGAKRGANGKNRLATGVLVKRGTCLKVGRRYFL